MDKSTLQKIAVVLCFIGAPAVAAPAARAEADANESISFERDVRPILKAYCMDCHGATEEIEGGLDLRLRRFLVKGGDSGAAIEPGDPDASFLIARVEAQEMPPGEKKLGADEIATLRRWIAAGAPTLRDEPEQLPPGIPITEEERAWWAFQPLERPEVPATDPTDRVHTPIDAFLLAAMKPLGLNFSPEADKRTLLRRAAFDLTGLPPTAEDMEAFLNDDSPEAYSRMLDRLLESPHYGERWGRHWLDVAGYADSDGATVADAKRPFAYKYRDYVIRSLNEDKPLNQFIIEQLAGDELVPQPYANLSPEQIEKLVATGFLRMAADGTGSGAPDLELAKNQVIADTLKIVGTSLLGLSVHCAQCHDHRYDPISHEDYFRLRAIFEPALDWKQWRTPAQRLISLYTDEERAQAAEIEKEVAVIAAERAEKQAEFIAAALEKELEKYPEDQRDALRDAYNTPARKRTPEQKKLLESNPSVNITPGVLYQYNQAAADELKKYDERIAAVRAKKPPEDFISVLTEIPGQVPTTFVFHRGDHRQPTKEVTPGGLTITAPEGQRLEIPLDDPELPTTGRRLAYARYLTSGRHPLVGRALANRIWLHHFGRGLVATAGDFGMLGEKPTHPELLDWLATELVEQGWSLKRMHKLIMMSAVYRQSSLRDPAKDAIDRENRYYWRMPVRRLEAESIRDHILVATGVLDRTLFGPAIAVSEDEVGQVNAPDDQPRRSIYLEARRSKPVSLLTAFDAPVMETNCELRTSSTVAPQALMLMNSQFILRQAERFAERVEAETPRGFRSELTGAWANRVRPRTEDWQYGYGQVDPTSGRVTAFTPLSHWTGSAWQGGPALPDPTTGWVLLHADGGHAGNDEAHAAIRRWTAPADGRLALSGKLAHGSENGNGVHARIVSSRSGILLDTMVHNGELETAVADVEVAAGDTIDLVIDCQGDVTSDSFHWQVELRLTGAAGEVQTWHSKSDFHGPPAASLAEQLAYAWHVAYQRDITPEELELTLAFCEQQLREMSASGMDNPQRRVMTNVCQTLLSSNEFLYVD